jgi:hypothetical protein
MLQQIQDPKLEKHENPEEDVTEADIKGAAGALFVAALDTVRFPPLLISCFTC